MKTTVIFYLHLTVHTLKNRPFPFFSRRHGCTSGSPLLPNKKERKINTWSLKFQGRGQQKYPDFMRREKSKQYEESDWSQLRNYKPRLFFSVSGTFVFVLLSVVSDHGRFYVSRSLNNFSWDKNSFFFLSNKGCYTHNLWKKIYILI